MFEKDAEKALTFYCGLFSNAKVENIDRYGPGEHGPEGSVRRAIFNLGNQRVMCIDSPGKHAFTFTPSFSFFVDCDDASEFQKLFDNLSDGGQVMMPPDDYGFSEKFAWTSDRFGVSWQINLPRKE